MKKIILTLAITGIALVSCKKTENSAENTTENTTVFSKSNSHEVSNTQDSKTFTNSKGDKLKVTYFAEGPNVMVKIQKNNEPEQKLSAKTVNAKGNPIFTNEIYMWEMKEGNVDGKLSDKDGNTIEYVEISSE